MLGQILLLIVFILVICLIISSISYSSNDKEMNKAKQVISKTFSIGPLKTEIINNCHIFRMENIQSTSAYLLEGKFDNSCLSIYKNGVRIHSRIVTGEKSFAFSSNLLLSSQLFKNAKFKSELLPLEDGCSYIISVNNVNDIQTKNYSVNYNIGKSPIIYTYTKNIGVNEYDIMQEIQSKYGELQRYNLRNIEVENKWVFNDTGNYLVILIRNLHNINITINETEYSLIRTTNIPFYEIMEITDPNIIAYNLDYKTRIKGINREYIDFITSPNHLMSKFLYGTKDKEIDYTSQINDKVIMYKIKNA